MPTIIHIGYPKTATTWFQKSIFPHIANFKYIPKKEIQKYIVSTTESQFEKFLPDFKNKLSYHNIILSDEDYVTNKPEHISPTEKAKRLQQLFPDAQIILFIRNQPDIISSAYSQYIKAGGTLNANQYIETLMYSKKLSHWQYDTIIKIYQNLFGKKSVHIYLYESIFHPNFLNIFTQHFNFQLKKDFVSTKQLNKQLCPTILTMTRFLNRFTKRQLYSKFPPKSYYFHIPFLFTVSRIKMNILNVIFCSSKRPNTYKILGKQNIKIIQDYFKASNNILMNDLIIKEIANYHYPF